MKGLKRMALAAVGVGFYMNCPSSDFLNGLNSNIHLSEWQLQLALGGFCVSPLVGKLKQAGEKADIDDARNTSYGFDDTGGVDEADYDKGSIYAGLYSLYAILGQLKLADGTSYEFTFNTWGVGPSDYPASDAQRYGKTSYGWFSKSPEVKEYIEKTNGDVQIVEIGSGTGAGASHLSQNVFPKSKYMAIDMQKAAIETCKRLHGSDRLECVHIATGVGNEGSRVPLPDNSVDFVIICETHIAEERIGREEKAIIAEISRILKPGGLFLWGNALPTSAWVTAEAYLPTVGYTTVTRWDNTQGAIQARDEDAVRVEAMMESIKQHFYPFHMPYFGEPCHHTIAMLIRNFYRHPGTAMYDKMVAGLHSYNHYVFRLAK